MGTDAVALQARLFEAALACLEEGSPLSRASGKKLLLALHLNVIEPKRFQTLLDKLQSQRNYVKVKEVIVSDQGRFICSICNSIIVELSVDKQHVIVHGRCPQLCMILLASVGLTTS